MAEVRRARAGAPWGRDPPGTIRDEALYQALATVDAPVSPRGLTPIAEWWRATRTADARSAA